MIRILRIDPARRMARFYSVGVQADLFGGVTLVREWGRIGQPGTTRLRFFADGDAGALAALRLEAAKRRRGYR